MNFLDNRKNRTITVVCLLIAFVCIYLIQDDSLFKMMSSTSSESIGNFENLKKDVRKKNLGNYFWEDLGKRDELLAGDSIYTGPGSSVVVKLYGGQTIAVAPNSLIKFRTKNKKLIIDIPYGGVQLDTAISKDLEIKDSESIVKDIVISDCGQDYSLKQGQNNLKFKKSEKCGSVTLDTKSLEEVRDFNEKKSKKEIKVTFLEAVDTGSIEQIIGSSTKQLEPLKIGLSAPSFKSLDVNYVVSKDKPVVLKWEPVQAARSYEIEVSETADFAKVKKYVLNKPQLTLNNITSNMFFRGKAVDSYDHASEFSETGKIKTQVPRIKITQPKISKNYQAKNPQDEGLVPGQFDVSWSEIPMAKNYSIEVRDPKTSRTIKKFNSRNPASVIEVPKVGKYAYQVHALDSQGRKISSSDVGEVLYNKVFGIAAPVIKQSLAEKFYFFQKDSAKYVWLSWIPQGPESRFRVEIAKDANFTSIIKSVFTTKQKLLVTEKVQAGEYFWRVRAEDKDRFSNWSNTEIFKVKISEARAPAAKPTTPPR